MVGHTVDQNWTCRQLKKRPVLKFPDLNLSNEKKNPSVTFLFKGHVFPVILSCGGVDEGGASWQGQDEAELDNCLG